MPVDPFGDGSDGFWGAPQANPVRMDRAIEIPSNKAVGRMAAG